MESGAYKFCFGLQIFGVDTLQFVVKAPQQQGNMGSHQDSGDYTEVLQSLGKPPERQDRMEAETSMLLFKAFVVCDVALSKGLPQTPHPGSASW